ncbi:MAG: alpha-amylase family glycosyl hydrolase, partial [Chloroflexia bacterium]
WPNWVLGNHDRHRIASRVGLAQSRMAQMLLLTLRGTPTCYYGDELAMTDVDIPTNKIQDPWGVNVQGLGLGRDPERTPMQWDASPNAGFSTAEPWLPLSDDYKTLNVEAEQGDPSSMLTFVQTLLSLRRKTPALTIGTVEIIDAGSNEILAYIRQHEANRLLIALNFSPKDHTLDLSPHTESPKITLSTHTPKHETTQLPTLTLRGNEGVIIHL